jgi:hypothetical protein
MIRLLQSNAHFQETVAETRIGDFVHTEEPIDLPGCRNDRREVCSGH